MAMQADAKKNSLQLRVLFLKGAVFLRVHLDHCRRGRPQIRWMKRVAKRQCCESPVLL
jgi:hypothetical protein